MVMRWAVRPAPDRPQRRRFSAGYTLAVLAEYEGLEANSEKGAMLRREGLRTLHLAEWRRACEAGALHHPGSSTNAPAAVSEAHLWPRRTVRSPGSRRPRTGWRWRSWDKHTPLGGACRERESGHQADEVMAALIAELDPLRGVRRACAVTGTSRASHYRAA
jgi:hypothetical protein